MKKFFTTMFQTAMTVAQIANVVSPVIPAEYKQYVTIGLGVSQIIQARMAHNYNPDGTPATTAYLPPKTYLGQ